MKVYQKIVFAIAALSLFAACSDKKETQTQEKIIPVKIMTVQMSRKRIETFTPPIKNYAELCST